LLVPRYDWAKLHKSILFYFKYSSLNRIYDSPLCSWAYILLYRAINKGFL
jgi:hypothetical protein